MSEREEEREREREEWREGARTKAKSFVPPLPLTRAKGKCPCPEVSTTVQCMELELSLHRPACYFQFSSFSLSLLHPFFNPFTSRARLHVPVSFPSRANATLWQLGWFWEEAKKRWSGLVEGGGAGGEEGGGGGGGGLHCIAFPVLKKAYRVSCNRRLFCTFFLFAPQRSL